MFRALIEMNLKQETLACHIIPTYQNLRHLSILKPSENQQRQPTANLPNRSNLMSLAACIPSSFKFFSICLLLALEALSSADIAHPMIKRNYQWHQFPRSSKNYRYICPQINSTIQFCNSNCSFLVPWSVGLWGSDLSLIPLTLLTSSLILFFASSLSQALVLLHHGGVLEWGLALFNITEPS